MSTVRPAAALCSIPALLLALSAAPGLADAAERAASAPDPAAAGAAETAPQPPALMLAQVYRPGIAVADFWVSEKLDGVRAYWDGQRLISRGGHPIRAPAWFSAGFPAQPLDGELWMGRGRFEAVSGTVRRLEPDEDAWRQVRYRVFDLPSDPGTFGERLARLEALVRTAANPRLERVEQTRIADHAALMQQLAAVVRAGGEGLMLHRDDARYRATRSADLLKVKLYRDAEARVVGHVPGKGKYRGMLGALEVEDARGRRFRLGTGFTDAERRDPPPLGSWVTFKYRGLTEEGLPRFASFLRIDPEAAQGRERALP